MRTYVYVNARVVRVSLLTGMFNERNKEARRNVHLGREKHKRRYNASYSQRCARSRLIFIKFITFTYGDSFLASYLRQDFLHCLLEGAINMKHCAHFIIRSRCSIEYNLYVWTGRRCTRSLQVFRKYLKNFMRGTSRMR